MFQFYYKEKESESLEQLQISETSHEISHVSPTVVSTKSNKLNFLNNPSKLENLLNEVQKLENHINSLSNKTLAASSTFLEKEWKELNDYQEKQSVNMTISVARCYPNKNRFQDLLPYDQTRVVLQNRNDDYINATKIGKIITNENVDNSKKNLQRQPSFIVAQVI